MEETRRDKKTEQGGKKVFMRERKELISEGERERMTKYKDGWIDV